MIGAEGQAERRHAQPVSVFTPAGSLPAVISLSVPLA